MKSLWIYMLVILVSVKCVASQCIGSETCDCHCECCSPVCLGSLYCTSCAKGWSGTTNNGCQRQNVAYNAEATSTSTYENFIARNAVDEDLSTYARTNREENPQLILKLSDIFNIKNMFLKAYAYWDSYYDVFVTNSVSDVLSDFNKCNRIFEYRGQTFERNVDCSRILTGDQIVVQIASSSASLLVYEVVVYQCSQGTYGDLCDRECRNCIDNKCDGQLGHCIDGCNERYTGTKCDTPCKDNCATCSTNDLCISCLNGRFGTNCEYLCPETCSGSKTCDKNSGVCSECNPGTFGPNCTEHCSGNCIPGTPSVCYKNGTCIRGCVDGWFGPQCNKQCPIETCEKCNLLSSGYFSCEICNIGYYLDTVQEICVKCPSRCVSCISDLRCTQCIPNFTGDQCENDCNINCVDGLCEFDRTCTYGCNNSRHGVGCEVDCVENCEHCYSGNNCTKCLPGYYGRDCLGKCYKNCFNCTSYYDCNACKPGFYGDWCYYNCDPRCLTCDSGDSCTSCRDSWSGRLCQCSKNCKNEDCGGDGICQSGCNGSYYGERCDVSCPSKNCQRCDQMSGNCTQCAKGLYGINCNEQCSRSCLGTTCIMTGACLRGCEDGFDGKECTEIRSSLHSAKKKIFKFQEKINFVVPDTGVKTDYKP